MCVPVVDLLPGLVSWLVYMYVQWSTCLVSWLVCVFMSTCWFVCVCVCVFVCVCVCVCVCVWCVCGVCGVCVCVVCVRPVVDRSCKLVCTSSGRPVTGSCVTGLACRLACVFMCCVDVEKVNNFYTRSVTYVTELRTTTNIREKRKRWKAKKKLSKEVNKPTIHDDGPI